MITTVRQYSSAEENIRQVHINSDTTGRDHRLGKDAKPGPTERELNRVIFVHRRPDADDHVKMWKAWRRINHPMTTPTEFMKAHCFLAGVSYDEVMAHRLRRNYAFRVDLLHRVMARYPKLRSMQLGVLFNRHHVSILTMLGRTASSKRRAAE